VWGCGSHLRDWSRDQWRTLKDRGAQHLDCMKSVNVLRSWAILCSKELPTHIIGLWMSDKSIENFLSSQLTNVNSDNVRCLWLTNMIAVSG
jgi:hypothetical protein